MLNVAFGATLIQHLQHIGAAAGGGAGGPVPWAVGRWAGALGRWAGGGAGGGAGAGHQRDDVARGVTVHSGRGRGIEAGADAIAEATP